MDGLRLRVQIKAVKWAAILKENRNTCRIRPPQIDPRRAKARLALKPQGARLGIPQPVFVRRKDRFALKAPLPAAFGVLNHAREVPTPFEIAQQKRNSSHVRPPALSPL